MPDVETCKFCGSEIAMVVTEKRHRIAVEKSGGGDLILLPGASARERRVVSLADLEFSGQMLPQRWRRHAPVCPERRMRRG